MIAALGVLWRRFRTYLTGVRCPICGLPVPDTAALGDHYALGHTPDEVDTWLASLNFQETP